MFFYRSPIAITLLLSISSAQSADYFDPIFLDILGGSESVDLTQFAEEGSIPPGEYPVSVFINQSSAGQFTLNFQKNPQGQTVPLLTPLFLEKLGVNVSNIPPLKNKPAETPLADLPALIPHAKTHFDLSKLRLDISVPQVAMQPNQVSNYNPELWDDGIPALLANYSLNAGQTRNDSGGYSANSNNIFASVRAGANAGPWRLRSTITHSRYTHSATTTTHQTRFSNLTLARDIRPLRSTLLMGETYTGGDIFEGIPFKGLKLTSTEEMLPSQLRGFAPAITGVANSNARVTVRQNGNIVYETYVAQGPFFINDISQAALSGNYDVTITEADGAERQFIVPYSSLPVMLRPGGWKYEVSAGRYDSNLTYGARDADFLLSTAVYGLPQNITLFGGTVLSEHYQAFSAGSGVSLGNLGAFSADVTHSNAGFQRETQTGESYRLRYSKSLTSTGTSVDLTALRYSTRHYFSFNEYNRQGYQLEEGVSPWLMQRRRSSFQTQINQNMSHWGALHFRLNRDDYWNSEKQLTGLSLGYSNTLYGISYGLNYNIDRIKDRDNHWPENRQIAVNISVPLSILGSSSNLQSMYATASTTHDNQGKTQNNMGVSGSLSGGNVSYSLAQSFGNQQQSTNTNATLAWQGSQGTVSAGYSYNNQYQAVNINAAGGMLVHSDGVIFSRSMGESVALVHAPDAAGVRVNNGSASTNAQGYAVAPYLSAYNKNSIGLDPSTLPEDIDLVQSNINVYPTKGAVVRANFKTRLGYQALITLKLNQGVVPFGAIASLLPPQQDEETSSIVGDAGQVYLTGLPPSGRLSVRWGEAENQQCQASFDISHLAVDADTSLRQVTLACLPEKSIAAATMAHSLSAPH